jgi:hypothetical protein
VARELGPDATPVASGEVGGVVDTRIGQIDQPEASVSGAVQGQDLEARRGADRLRDRADAAPDPQGDLARAEKLEFNERDKALGQVSGVEDKGDDARRIAGDPQAAATTRAEGTALREASERAPLDPDQARADVNVATGTVRDPSGAAEGQLDLEVEDREREAEAQIGISGTVKPPDPAKR